MQISTCHFIFTAIFYVILDSLDVVFVKAVG